MDNNVLIFVIVLSVFLLLVIGLIIYYAVKDRKKASSMPTPSSSFVPDASEIELYDDFPEEKQPKVNAECMYQYTAANTKKVCPCCTCENPLNAICCEVCGVTF